MAWKRRLWSTDLALVTCLRLDVLYLLQFYVLYSLHTQSGHSCSSPWPRRGTCGPPTWPWPPCRHWSASSWVISCPQIPSCQIWGLFFIPTAKKVHHWPTELTLVNLDGSKKFLCENVFSHALYHPTKFQPHWSRHLGVY